MISYAQNFEDVMLWRALRHVKNGFYIDVGAYHPANDSVTKWFYDQGWTGINIEPAEELIEQFHNDRSNDINLGVAVSDKNEVADYFFVKDTGLSTMDKNSLDFIEQSGFTIQTRNITCKTLNTIIEELKINKEIHFLKIDVEGFEYNVLQGIDLNKYTPWIILVEANEILSQIKKFSSWEPIILDSGYDFVYDDGLNRFYVHQSRTELKKVFIYPPNVFDGFEKYKPDINYHNQLNEQISSIYDFLKKDKNEVSDQISDLLTRWNESNIHHQKSEEKSVRIIAALEEKIELLHQISNDYKSNINEYIHLLKEIDQKIAESDSVIKKLEIANIESEQFFNSYVNELKSQILKLQDSELQAVNQINALNSQILHLQNSENQATSQINSLMTQVDYYRSLASDRTNQYEAILNSRSWKATFPIRKIISATFILRDSIIYSTLRIVRKNEFVRSRLEKLLLSTGPMGKYFFSYALTKPYPNSAQSAPQQTPIKATKISSSVKIYHNILDSVPDEILENYKNILN